MKKQIYCNHYKKEVEKTSVYSYSLVNCELNLCERCERRLRKQIIQQDKDENEIKEMIKEHDD